MAVWIYHSTTNFPPEETFGMVSQMRRASISIASNIAEGTSRKTSKDQSHFSTISYIFSSFNLFPEHNSYPLPLHLPVHSVYPQLLPPALFIILFSSQFFTILNSITSNYFIIFSPYLSLSSLSLCFSLCLCLSLFLFFSPFLFLSFFLSIHSPSLTFI